MRSVPGGKSVLNVHLACGSGLLDGLVRLALRAVPRVVLVGYDSARVDVAVVIIPDAGGESVDWVQGAGPARFVIGLDQQRNVLRIRGGERASTGEKIVSGTLAKLIEVVRDLQRGDAGGLASLHHPADEGHQIGQPGVLGQRRHRI